MRTIANIALGLAVGCTAAWITIHRRALYAAIKGEPLPEPPAWHAGHACLKG